MSKKSKSIIYFCLIILTTPFMVYYIVKTTIFDIRSDASPGNIYKGITINSADRYKLVYKYKGNDKWEYTVSGMPPTSCHTPEISAEVSGVANSLKDNSSGVGVTQVKVTLFFEEPSNCNKMSPRPFLKTGHFTAGKKILVEFKTPIQNEDNDSDNTVVNKTSNSFNFRAIYNKDEYWEYEIGGPLGGCYRGEVLTYIPAHKYKGEEYLYFNVLLRDQSKEDKDIACAAVVANFEHKGKIEGSKDTVLEFNVIDVHSAKDGDKRGTITLEKGEYIRMTMDYNITTGYMEVFPEYDTEILELISKSTESKNSGLPGGNKTTISYYFRAINKGSSTIILGTHPPGMTDQDRELYRKIRVTVKDTKAEEKQSEADNTEIPQNCISWFDGCNTCMIEDGKIISCTLIACKEGTKARAYCKTYASD